MQEAPISFYQTPEEIITKEKLLESNEFKIKKDNNLINIIIGRTKESIIIRSLYYEIKFYPNDLTILTKFICNSLEESYELIKNSFEQNKIQIKDITKSMIKLVILFYDLIKRKEREVEICLMAQFKNEEYIIYNIINKCSELEQDLNNLKNNYKDISEENNQIKEENIKLKNDVISIKSENENMRKENIIIINKINDENSKLKEEILEMKTDIISLKNENKMFKNENKVIIQNYNTIKDECSKLKEDNSKINYNIISLITENEQLKEEIKEINNDIMTIKSDLEVLKNEYKRIIASQKDPQIEEDKPILINQLKKKENNNFIGVIFKKGVGITYQYILNVYLMKKYQI